MYTMKLLIVGAPKIGSRPAYYQNRRHCNHRTLVDIDVRFHGCLCGRELKLKAMELAGWPDDPKRVKCVEYIGGSSYGAFLTEAERGKWIDDFCAEMRITVAAIGVHIRHTGRIDFHILTPLLLETNRKKQRSGLLHRARATARKLTRELNEGRLREGRNTIANFPEDATTTPFYLQAEPKAPVKEPIKGIGEYPGGRAYPEGTGTKPVVPIVSPSLPVPQPPDEGNADDEKERARRKREAAQIELIRLIMAKTLLQWQELLGWLQGIPEPHDLCPVDWRPVCDPVSIILKNASKRQLQLQKAPLFMALVLPQVLALARDEVRAEVLGTVQRVDELIENFGKPGELGQNLDVNPKAGPGMS